MMTRSLAVRPLGPYAEPPVLDRAPTRSGPVWAPSSACPARLPPGRSRRPCSSSRAGSPSGSAAWSGRHHRRAARPTADRPASCVDRGREVLDVLELQIGRVVQVDIRVPELVQVQRPATRPVRVLHDPRAVVRRLDLTRPWGDQRQTWYRSAPAASGRAAACAPRSTTVSTAPATTSTPPSVSTIVLIGDLGHEHEPGQHRARRSRRPWRRRTAGRPPCPSWPELPSRSLVTIGVTRGQQ